VAGVAGENNHTYIRNINTTDLSNNVNGRLVVVDLNTGLLGFVSVSLNEVLKEAAKVEEQQASIAELKTIIAQQKKGMEVLTAQLKEQAAQIQKVSAQLELSKPAPQTVLSNQ
jgi:septal ring factor EnvC (AmiA/AmiB activator)